MASSTMYVVSNSRDTKIHVLYAISPPAALFTWYQLSIYACQMVRAEKTLASWWVTIILIIDPCILFWSCRDRVIPIIGVSYYHNDFFLYSAEVCVFPCTPSSSLYQILRYFLCRTYICEHEQRIVSITFARLYYITIPNAAIHS